MGSDADSPRGGGSKGEPPSSAIPETGFRGDIQGMRGVAVLLVVLYHTGVAPFTGGFIGVDVFFVLSGFVITRLLYAELVRTGRISLLGFYARRIRRLLPALGLVLVVIVLLSSWYAPFEGVEQSSKTAVATALLSANAYLYANTPGYFEAAAESNAFLHTWSLSLEEQFYLVFPALLIAGWWIAGRRRSRSGVLFSVMGAVTVVSLALCVLMTADVVSLPGIEASRRFAFYSPFTRAWEFAVGGLLVLWVWRRTWSSLARTIMIGGGLTLIGIAAVTYDQFTAFPGWTAVLPVLGTLLVIEAGTGGEVAGSRAIAVRPLVFLGDISYSWYLWHWPLIVFATATFPASNRAALVAGALSIIPAVLSYRLVENPIRRNKRIVGWRVGILGIACLAIPVVVGLGNAVIWEQVGKQADVAAFRAGYRNHAYVEAGCEGTPIGTEPTACLWNEDGLRRIAIVGDSQAGQFIESFTEPAPDWDASVELAAMGFCLFADVQIETIGFRNTECTEFVEATRASLAAVPPDLLVLASATDSYLGDPIHRFLDPETGRYTDDPERKKQIWHDGMVALLEGLPLDETQILYIDSNYAFGDWDPKTCSAAAMKNRPDDCIVSGLTDDLETERQIAIDAVDLLEQDFPTMIVTDVAPLMCPGEVCLTVREDGTWMWRDGTHVSVDTAVGLGAHFGQYVIPALGAKR